MSEETPNNKTESNSKTSHKNSAAGGLRGIKTTAAFRAFNFELFVRPNKVIMGLGLTALTGCVAYLAYMHAVSENTASGVYEVYDVDGSFQTTQRKRSKWE